MNPLDRVVAWWRGVNPWWKDGLLAACFTVGSVVTLVTVWSPSEPDVRDPDAFAVALTLLSALPIAVRRVAPQLVLYTVGAAAAGLLVLDYPDTSGGLSVIIAIYTVASLCDRRRSSFAAGFVAVILFAIWISGPAEDDFALADLVSNFLVYGTAWILGDYIRIRRLRQDELEERARRLEDERDEQARRAVQDERARIARELHDVVAHSMSVMTVQAGAARRVVERDPLQAREALVAIETTGRDALAEMRRLLGVLREQTDGEERAPVPGLARVAGLVQQVRDAGLAVELVEELDGGDGPLPQGIDVSAFRIVQEALTNALKHAGPARVRVAVRRLDEVVDIEVVDDGLGLAAHGRADGTEGGHGLVGMRERVALFGGTLEAGPRSGGGFRVHARLPVAGTSHLVAGAP